MKRLLVLGLALSASVAQADVIGPGGKVIDCYCTDRSGSRIELGETICMQVDGRMFMAQCQMSLNVPMWREVQEGCLSSSLDPALGQSLGLGANPGQIGQPAIDAGAVHPQI